MKYLRFLGNLKAERIFFTKKLISHKDAKAQRKMLRIFPFRGLAPLWHTLIEAKLRTIHFSCLLKII